MANNQADLGTAVTWEDRAWNSDAPLDGIGRLSRRQQLLARGPYRSAIPAAIANLHVALPADVAAASEDALMEITRFDTELSSLLPALAESDEGGELAPLAAVLLRTESASSSQIEHVTAGAKALALASLHEKAGPNAQMVAANVEAMQRAFDIADEPTTESVLRAHAALMVGHPYAQPGQLRSGQVWIGATAPTPHTASFVPPHPDRVELAIEDLISFCRRTDMPVLSHAAIAHAQFETIHPFADGNGRVGRVLVHALLRRAGTTRRMTVPVSAGLLTDTSSYFDALTSYRDGDPAAIVERFTTASFAAVTNGRVLAADLRSTYDSWTDSIRARQGAAAWRLLPMLIRQPAVTSAHVQQHAGVSQPAADRAISTLVDAGVLSPATSNRRNRVWVADEVISALDAFAARVGRRA